MTTARGSGLVGDEPGEDRDDLARAGERLPRLERDQRPGGGELDPPARGRQRLDQRVGAAAGRQGVAVGHLPQGRRRPRRPGRTCRRRSPSRSTSASTSGPAASAAANVLGRVAGGERGEADALDRLLQRQAQEGDLRRHVRRVELRAPRAPAAGRSTPRPRSASPGSGPGPAWPASQVQRINGVAGERGPRGGDNAAPRRSARGPATAAALRTAGRSAARSRAGRPRARDVGDARGRVRARQERQVRDGPRVADAAEHRRPRRRPRPASGLSRVAIKGGTADRSSRPMLRTIRARSLGREPRLLERLDQKRARRKAPPRGAARRRSPAPRSSSSRRR